MSDQLQQLDVLIVIDGFNSDKLNVDNCSTARFVPSCLGWVSKLSSPNVIVAFANQPSEIAVEFSKKWSSKFKQFQAFCVSNCQSLNDVLREVDFRQILRNDFMLIQNSSAFCSNCLTRQIEKFRNGRRQNKKNVLTLLYYPKLDYGRKLEERRSLIGYIEQSQKLTHFENISKNEPFSISKSAFLLDTIFRTDIAFCGIALCGIEFSGHFAGNYDLLSFDAIISDILSNEEILMQNIHVDFVEDIYTKANDSSLNSSAERKTNDCAGAYSASISSSISLTNLLIGSDSDSPSDDDTVRQEKRTSDQIDCQSNNTHNQSSFVAEVIDSLQGVLEDGFSNGENRVSADLLNKIKLEINASKLAYNIPAEDVPNHLFTAFLRLPGVVDNFSEFTKMYNHWRGLWKMFFKSAKSQSQMLNAIEEKAIDSDRFRRVLPKVLYFLSQDAKALDDCLIVDWYSKLSEKSPLNKEKRLVELVSWLQNAEESSETDEGDGNDDDD